MEVRCLHILMVSVALIVAYILRVNMSVAIVAMTDMKHANTSENTGLSKVYKWDESEKSAILSSFFGGYMLLQIIAGLMAERYGSKPILAIGMAISSLATIIIPFVAKYGYQAVVAVRVLQGASQGLFYPSIMVLLSKWIPPSERNRATSLTFSSITTGTLIGLPLSGYLAATQFGWPSIFFVTGSLGFLWILLWLVFGASTPQKHSFISVMERNYIEESLQSVKKNEQVLKTPWKHIVTSAPVWAILVSHLGENWAYWTLLTETPNFINGVFGVDIKQNGILSSLPYLSGWATAVLFSIIGHKIQERKCLSSTVQRKVWNSIALWGGSLGLLILGTLDTKDASVLIAVLILTESMNSGIYTGFLTNHVEVSPNFCGTLMGITNSLACIPSALAPLAVGWIISDPSSQAQWKSVFLLSSVIMFGTNLFYVIFASTEVQSWNNLSQDTTSSTGSQMNQR